MPVRAPLNGLCEYYPRPTPPQGSPQVPPECRTGPTTYDERQFKLFFSHHGPPPSPLLQEKMAAAATCVCASSSPCLCVLHALTLPACARRPNVLWAERSDRVFVTIEVTDAQSPKVDIGADGRLTFAGCNGEGKLYELDLQLAGPVSSSESKVAVTPRHVLLVLQKSSPGPHWGRLLKAAGKAPHNVKVDWTKYVDEDEEAAEASKGACLDT